MGDGEVENEIYGVGHLFSRLIYISGRPFEDQKCREVEVTLLTSFDSQNSASFLNSHPKF